MVYFKLVEGRRCPLDGSSKMTGMTNVGKVASKGRGSAGSPGSPAAPGFAGSGRGVGRHSPSVQAALKRYGSAPGGGMIDLSPCR